jgi:hypothetical protein
VAFALALVATCVPGPAQAEPAGCAETSQAPSSAAALKPSDVLLAITAPRAGETLLAAPQNGSVSVAVDYWGPALIYAERAHGTDNYHLVYILDEDASPYIGTLQGMPNCDPRIVHSAATRVTFDNVSHGGHALTVLLAGSNDVSVNPPVAARVTFMVR